MPLRRLCRFCLSASAAFLMLASPGWGQATGTILGNITDPAGRIVAGANVSATNAGTNVTKSTTTNDSGYYQIVDLIPGQYTVSAEMAGFKKTVRPQFELQIGQFARVDLELQLGSLSESVQVAAEAPLLSTAEATVGQVVGVRETQELPLNGRNYLQLVTLAPGTSTYGGRSFYTSALTDNTGSVISGGAGDERNEVSLDGVSVKSYMINYAYVPSIDAIREFKVETTPYSAELGRSAGAQIRLESRSGGNQYHGSAYEFLRNSKLDAKNFFDRPDRPIPPFKLNQFGASLGGPIIRDKLFFFMNYEGYRDRVGQTFFGTVPTPLMKQGVFTEEGRTIFDPLTTRPDPNNSGSFIREVFPTNTVPTGRINPVSAFFAKSLYPDPTGPGLVNNFATSASDQTQRDQFNTRVDYARGKDTIFGRFSFNDSTLFRSKGVFGQALLPNFGDSFINNTRNAVISDVHLFNPTTILEGRVSFFRNRPLIGPQQLGNAVNQQFGVQGVRQNEPLNPTVTGFLNPISNPFAPEFFVANQYQYVLNLTKTLSKHTFKMGGEYNRLQLFEVAPRNPQGAFTFTGNFTENPNAALGSTGRPFADFLLGFPVSAQTIRGDTGGQLFRNLFYGFFNDNWRVSPNLSLNLGVRYEYTGNAYDKYDRISNFDPSTGQLLLAGKNGQNRSTVDPNWHNFAPRFGFAYTIPSHKLSIRGGYGIFYDIVQMNTFNAVRANIPFTEFRNFAVDNPTTKVPDTRTQDVFGTGGGQPPLPTISAIDPHLKQGYMQQSSFTVERQFAGSFLAELGYVWSHSSKFTAGRDLDAPLQRGTFIRPYPQYQGISQVANIEDGNYNALLAKLEKRFSKGISFLVSYTFAKTIDNNSTGSAVLTPSGSSDGFQNPYCFSCNRGRADSDNRQRFVTSWVYEVPRLKQMGSVASAVLGGWQISGILSAQTGFPITPRVSGDNSLSRGGGDRPDRVEGTPIFGPGARDPARWFNRAAFVVPPRGQFGQVGRNVFDGPGLFTIDAAVMKNFYLTEQMRLQFRSEFFNLTNHPNFAFPNAAINTSTVGLITSTTTTSRQIQFALKLTF